MSDYQSRNVDTGTGNTDMTNEGGAEQGATQQGGSEQGGTRQRMQDKANEAMGRMSGKLGEAGESMSRMSQEMSDRLRTGVDRMRTMDRTELSIMYDDVLEQARANPGRTILISAGIGVVVGMLMRGGRRDL